MKKSEMIRAALTRVRRLGKDQRVCYCTPNRGLVLSMETVVQNNLAEFKDVSPRSMLSEMLSTVAEKMREVTNRTSQGESLREFDTEDTPAAMALTDEVVEEAFEKAALTYEEQGE